MYTKFYGFKSRPFDLLPDPRFLYISKKHDLALAHLEYGITDNKGFIVLIGDVGTGKTTLINFLLNKIPEYVDTALIFNTNIDHISFLEMVAKEFGLDIPDSRPSGLYDAIYRFLLQGYVKGRRSVLIIDEAQNMPRETLEEVRMLSNFQTDECYLLQIIMSGQPQLKKRLNDPTLAQLAQRISVYYQLIPLDESETSHYIDHRLKVSGYNSSDPLFTHEAIKKIFEYTQGIPRLISAICDTALTYGYADEIKTVDLKIIEKVIEDRGITVSDVQESEEEKGNENIPLRQEETVQKPDSIIEHVCIEITNLNDRLTRIEQRLDDSETAKNRQTTTHLIELLKKSREAHQELREKYTILLQNYKKLLNQKISETENNRLQEKSRG
jgi:general secretion pathway protein A